MAIRASRKPSNPESFIAGVPNRSLTEEDWDALSPEERKRVEDSGLYTLRSEAEMHPSAVASSSSAGSDKKDDGK